MPNRLIHDCALTSRKINKLTDSEEKFFWRLVMCCDDYGCFFGEQDVLNGKLYPRQNRYTDDDVLSYRNAIVDVGLAFLYEEDGEIYICINKWEDLQKVRTPRRKHPEPTKKNRLLQQSATICDKMLQSETEVHKKMSTRARRIQSNPIQSNPF